jgi:D,D-heptose 1,7-bisphosphate phosphatase
MQAVILAGGLGTRLNDVAPNIPKAMMPIGNVPVIEHQIILLKKYGVTDIAVIVNHLKEHIQVHLGNGSRWGVELSYYEEKTPLGTVGGIKAIEDFLIGDFIVLYGDVMLDMDVTRLIHFHQQTQSECTLVLHANDHPFDSDLVELDEASRITAFHSKPHDNAKFYRNMVNAGMYIMSKKVLSFLEPGKKADFGKDIFPSLCTQIKMMGYNTSEYLKDMGTPERLHQVNKDFNEGKIQQRNLSNKQKAIFLDRDGVLNVDIDLLANVDELEVFPYAPSVVWKINQSGYLAIVITNQSIIARNLCTEAGLRNIHNKLETILGTAHAKIDGLYYCPHHPDTGFPEENSKYKIECDCRKPKPGMLLQAARDFNIDLSASWFIGDSGRDIVAGKAAGVRTVGVRTGRGANGFPTPPEFLFKDLEEAVNYILGTDS